jgi:integrase
MDRQRVGKIVGEAAQAATKRLSASGLPPLPNTTPHTLRRTYISIALIANNFDMKWVMGQVGHADSKMTMDVYAQLEQRIKRDHGASFDRLVRTARDQLATVNDATPTRPAASRRPSSSTGEDHPQLRLQL